MVLPWRRGGRVGRCRNILRRGPFGGLDSFKGKFWAMARRPPSRRSPRGRPPPSARRRGPGPRERQPAPRKGDSPLTREALAEVRSAAGAKAPRVLALLEKAVEALARDDPREAGRLAEEARRFAPRSSSAREVLGLALYRSGRFRDALRELQAYRRISGRPDQNHLLADSHRAVGSPEKAVPLVQEALSADIPEEARAEAAVVGGAALADMGRFDEALALLRRFDTSGSSSRPHDLRVWYVMGDVLEKIGRRSEAADRFRRILDHDPDAYDVAERLSALS